MAKNSELMTRTPVAPQALALRPDPIAELAKSEIGMAVSFAMEHPRDIARFLERAQSQACLTEEIAKSCIYALPRGGKSITGPSVRLAEIVLSNYQHLRVATRFVEDQGTRVVCQAMIIDLENNNQLMDEVHVPVVRKDGSRYDEDMIAVAIAAGKAKARRNVIFQIVPRAYTDQIFEECRAVVRGDRRAVAEKEKKTSSKKITLAERIDKAIAYFTSMGVPREAILHRCGKPDASALTADDVEMLVGFATALKEPGSDTSLDDLFPPVPKIEEPKVGKSSKAAAIDAESEPLGTDSIFS